MENHTEVLPVVVAYAGLEAVRWRRGGGHFLRTVPRTCNRKVGFLAEKDSASGNWKGKQYIYFMQKIINKKRGDQLSSVFIWLII